MISPSRHPVPFSIDHLLLAGLIIDRGQLSLTQRVDLDRRAARGELIKEIYWGKGGVEQECWKVKRV